MNDTQSAIDAQERHDVMSMLDAWVRIFHKERTMSTAVVTEIDTKEVLAFPVGPVAVFCWHDRPSIAALSATQEFFLAHYQGRDMVMLAIVESTSSPPDPSERSHILASIHRFTRLRGVANVIEGEGFKAAALRAVLTGLNLALRQAYPVRICASPSEAAPWLLERVPGHGTSPEQLVQAVERRRQAWRASSPRR